MPELPEVETIKRQLAQKIVGKRISKVQVLVAKPVNLPIKRYESILGGRKIEAVDRRAKILIWQISGGWWLLFHLKMTGQVIMVNESAEPTKAARVIFWLKENGKIFFNDSRKFGWARLLKTAEKDKILSQFGPEPFSSRFTLNYFKEVLKRRKRSRIKTVLLDQKEIAGIGNIYSSEALFRAKIHPERAAGNLSDPEIKDLYKEIKRVLKLAIAKRGSSDNYYVDAYGRKGEMVPLLQVYRRQGKKCYRCHRGVIKRIVVGGRGTFYCPVCQKK